MQLLRIDNEAGAGAGVASGQWRRRLQLRDAHNKRPPRQLIEIYK